MARRESVVESYLKKRVEALGGACEKHVNPAARGEPDRIVSFPEPNGGSCLVETKWAEGVQPEPHQLRRHDWWRKRGMTVYVVRSKAEVDVFCLHRARVFN